jgi:hypothetical protein
MTEQNSAAVRDQVAEWAREHGDPLAPAPTRRGVDARYALVADLLERIESCQRFLSLGEKHDATAALHVRAALCEAQDELRRRMGVKPPQVTFSVKVDAKNFERCLRITRAQLEEAIRPLAPNERAAGGLVYRDARDLPLLGAESTLTDPQACEIACLVDNLVRNGGEERYDVNVGDGIMKILAPEDWDKVARFSRPEYARALVEVTEKVVQPSLIVRVREVRRVMIEQSGAA